MRNLSGLALPERSVDAMIRRAVGGSRMIHQPNQDGESQGLERVEFLHEGVQQYAKACGLELPDCDYSNVVADPELGREIAAAYEAEPHDDPTAREAYYIFG